MSSDLATFEVSGNPAVRAVRLPCLPENVPFVAQQGTASLRAALGFPLALPPLREPRHLDPMAEPEEVA